MSPLSRSDSDSEGENPEKKKLQEQLMGEGLWWLRWTCLHWLSGGVSRGIPKRPSLRSGCREGDRLWDTHEHIAGVQ